MDSEAQRAYNGTRLLRNPLLNQNQNIFTPFLAISFDREINSPKSDTKNVLLQIS
jgi:hypothetical protein